MKTRTRSHFIIILLAIICFAPMTGHTQKVISLPAPQTDGGMPLMKALKNRHTTREFAELKLSDQVLSNLLWAAWGINRSDVKKRTAPSAMNTQEIEVYVSMSTGVFLYNAEKNSLIQVSSEDVRNKTGIQDFVKTAPVNLVFVADYTKLTPSTKEEDKEKYTFADAAYISENVYLFCASEGMATGVRANIDKEVCSVALKLKPQEHVILGQSVGYPK